MELRGGTYTQPSLLYMNMELKGSHISESTVHGTNEESHTTDSTVQRTLIDMRHIRIVECTEHAAQLMGSHMHTTESTVHGAQGV